MYRFLTTQQQLKRCGNSITEPPKKFEELDNFSFGRSAAMAHLIPAFPSSLTTVISLLLPLVLLALATFALLWLSKLVTIYLWNSYQV